MLKKITYNAAATSVSVASGLLRNKIFALFLSLNLFGVLSIGQQSVSLAMTLFAFGLPLGITTLVSQYLSRPATEQAEMVTRLLLLAASVAGVLALIVVGVFALSPESLSLAVTGSNAFEIPMAILLLSAPLMLFETCLFAVMEGMGKVNEIVLFRIIPSLISLPILYFLAAEFHLVGAASGLFINEAILVGLGLFLLRKHLTFTSSALKLGPAIVQVYKVAVLSFGVGAFWFISDFIVKRYVLTALGEVENGIVQSVAKIADLYPTIALAWLSMHLFPVLSQRIDDKAAVASALQRTVLVAVVIIIPIIVILFTFRAEVLLIVYKKEFQIAVQYFGAMLAVGIVKVFSWVIGLALLPLGMKKQWFYSAVLMTILYSVGVWLGMLAGLSIYAIPVSLGISLGIQAAYVLVVYRWRKIVFDASFLLQTILFGVMSALLVVAVFIPASLIAVVLLFAWLVYRYDLLNEIREKIHEFTSRLAS
ncbi:MAG: polysaccharide biosynthesis C-terminal domain-containing protein [Ignavibacteriae bacterium]|nr:polysaccharide biosynthesis C-terminal domain-containing protein [Ignavibacteriota bacterium]